MRLVSIAIVLFATAAAAQSNSDESGFDYLFDGSSLDGWDGDLSIWSVQDGKIVGKSNGLTENVFLVTEESFLDFELRFDVLVVDGVGNSGVQFRSERIPDSTQVAGYQADVGEVLWGSLYDEARRNILLSSPDPDAVERLSLELGFPLEIVDRTPAADLHAFQASLSADGWNEFVVRANGRQITIVVNGYTTVSYRETDSEYVKPGIIGLQVHSGAPMEVHFRDIRINQLASAE
jgi:hypothetical protein